MHSRLQSLEAKLDSALNFGKYSDEWDVEQAKSIARQRAAGRQYRVDKKVDKKSAKEGYRKALDDDNRKVGVAGGRLIDNTHTLRGGAIGMAGGAAVGAMAGRKLAGRHGGKAGRIARVAGMAGGALHGGIFGGQLGLIPGSKIDKKPKKKEKSLEARLNGVLNFEKLDLGYTNKEVYGDDSSIGCYDHKAEQTKKRFPTFHVNRLKGDPFDFPDEGEATIKFKVTSRETRNNNGKENNSLSLEIQSIDPVKKKADKKELSRKSKRIVNLEAKIDRAFHFTDPRPRDQTGQFSNVTTAGANPDAMRKAYGSQSRINPDALKKLKRKLPRAMAQSMI